MVEGFSDRNALVTGASTGLGATTALALARCGARTILVARRISLLRKHVAEIHAKGGQAIPIACNLQCPTEVAALVKHLNAEYGGIDLLVNNAGTFTAEHKRGQIRL